MKNNHTNKITKQFLLGVAICTLLIPACGINAVYAATPAKTPEGSSIISSNYTQQVYEADSMLTKINEARLALDFHKQDDASKAITKALKLAHQLEKNAPEIKARETVKYGKVTYNINGQSKDYYIPVKDTLSAIDVIKDVAKKGQPQTAEFTDSGFVHTRVKIDIKAVIASLEKANGLVTSNKLQEASDEIEKISRDTIEEVAVTKNPLWTIEDNLLLATHFAADNNQQGAIFALAHAQAGLKALKNSNTNVANLTAVENISDQADALAASLKAQPHGTSKILVEAKAKLEALSNDFKQWRTEAKL